MKKTWTVLLFLAALTSSRAVTVLSDDFTYGNGPIVGAANSPWFTHSGVSGQVDVSGGRVNLTELETEDVSIALPGDGYATGFLYAGFIVNFTALPTSSGTYFASFRDGTTGYRARVYTSTNNAAPGLFRLGIGSASALTPTAAFVPLDLALQQDYHVVIRYDVSGSSSPISTLWLNPTSELDTANRANATDLFTETPPMLNFSLRQSLSGFGMGQLSFDNLVIATDFASVVPEPHVLGLAGVLFLGRRFLRGQAC